MRPAQETITAPAFWIVREQADFTYEAALFEHPILVLRLLPFHRSPSVSQLLYIPDFGERYTYMSMKLYVGNLAFQTNSQQLQELFAQAGTVESASVVEDRDTGRSRGFGFVEMSSKEEATSAIERFNGKEFNGRNLNVNEAKPRENRGFSGGNRNGGGNRDFGGRNDRAPRW